MTTQPKVLRVPLDRVLNPDGQVVNRGQDYIDVPVVIDPNLSRLGEYGYTFDYRRVIYLREWNEQVLLHELMHVVLDPLLLGTEDDPYFHNVIARVEVALWETGWRLQGVGENA